MRRYSVISSMFDDFGPVHVGSILVEKNKIQFNGDTGISGDLYVPKLSEIPLPVVPTYTKYENKCISVKYLWEVGRVDNIFNSFVRTDIVPGDLVILQVEIPEQFNSLTSSLRPKLSLGTIGVYAGSESEKIAHVTFSVDDYPVHAPVSINDLDFACKMGSIFNGTIEEQAPVNNDGRTECFWCQRKTRVVDVGVKFYNICPVCKK